MPTRLRPRALSRMIGRRPAAALAVTVAAGLLAGVPPGAGAQTVGQLRTGENYRLGTDPTASRGRDVPALAVNPADPDHMVVVDEDLYDGFCDYHTSFDGGRTWTSGHLTAPAGFEPQACSRFDGGDYLHLDGSVKWGSGNNVYTTFSWNRPGETDSTLVARSTDGGRTFAPAVVAVPGVPPPSDPGAEGPVRPELAVQPRPEGDRIYVTTWWIHLVAVTPATGPDRRAVTTRSDDGGLTWTAPVDAQAPGERARELTEPVIAPDGTVYTAWRTQTTGSGAANFIVVARSTDLGQNWARVNVRQISGTTGAMPSLEVSPTTGTLYLAYEDPPSGDRDIRLQRSTDGGLTWSTPARVNDDAAGNRVEQRLPDVSVAPNGRVDVAWHDRRHAYPVPTGQGFRGMGDTYYAYSLDDGASFSANRRITDRTYNLNVGLDQPVGTYTWYGAVVAPLGNDHVLFAWPDTREGNFDNGTQDIYLARLDLHAGAAVPVKRMEGDNASLSARLARLAYPGGLEPVGTTAASKVVIVNESDATGALAGAVLARANWGPLLASPADGLPAVVKDEVSHMQAVGAYVIGDERALSTVVVRDLVEAGVPEDKVVRLAGADPADTARLVAEAMDVRNAEARADATPAAQGAVVVNPASGDTTVAVGLAASLRMPLLFAGATSLPATTGAALSAGAIDETLVVGPTGAVGDGVMAQLPGATRLGGDAAVVAAARARGLPTNLVFAADPQRPLDAALAASTVSRLGGLLVPSATDDAALSATLDRFGLRTLADRVVAVAGTGVRGGLGYWLVASDGGVFSFGGAPFVGSTGGMRLNRPVIGMAGAPSGNGYWLVATDGGVFAFGDARFHGSTGALTLNRPVVGMARTPSGSGYWLVASDGGVFAFGDAAFHGSTASFPLNRPVVAMATTPSGDGYWLVASDGGVFAFGDARFHGSTGSMSLNFPVVAAAPTPAGKGYLLTASDGGVFAFGDAAFHGSTGALRLNRPIAGLSTTPSGQGYWLVASDGGIFAFGDAAFHGSTGALRLNEPVVAMAGRRPE